MQAILCVWIRSFSGDRFAARLLDKLSNCRRWVVAHHPIRAVSFRRDTLRDPTVGLPSLDVDAARRYLGIAAALDRHLPGVFATARPAPVPPRSTAALVRAAG